MVKKQKYGYSTVGDLKRVISDLPDDMFIGVEGHFGELNKLDVRDISVCNSWPVPIGQRWRDAIGMTPIECLIFPFIDIGPDPD